MFFATLDSLAGEWLVQQPSASPQAISNTLWAFATLNLPIPQKLCAALIQHHRRVFPASDDSNNHTVPTPQALTNVAWALATLRYQPAATVLLPHWDQVHAERLVQQGKPQNLSNFAWACATLMVPARNFWYHLDRSEPAIQQLIRQGTPQAIANVVWATATLKLPAPHLLQCVAQPAVFHGLLWKRGIKPQNVSNFAWACAVLQHPIPQFWSALEQQQHQQSNQLLQQCSHREYANLVWAAATFQIQLPQLWSALDYHVQQPALLRDPLATALAAWACATVQYERADRLFAGINRNAPALVESPLAQTQTMANTAWACATLQYHVPEFFRAADQRAAWLIETTEQPQEIGNLVWSFVKLGYPAPNLFRALDSDALDRIFALPTSVSDNKNNLQQEIANTLWAYAMSLDGNSDTDTRRRQASALEQLWQRAVTLLTAHNVIFHDDSLSQLAVTRWYAQGYGVALSEAPHAVEEALQKACGPVQHYPSRAAHSISRALTQMGWVHSMEVVVSNNNDENDKNSFPLGQMLAVDLACVHRKIAIEFDGPLHFLKQPLEDNHNNAEQGRTQAKHRLLRHLGWSVVSLDYRDFGRAQQENCVHQWLSEELEKAAGVRL